MGVPAGLKPPIWQTTPESRVFCTKIISPHCTEIVRSFSANCASCHFKRVIPCPLACDLHPKLNWSEIPWEHCLTRETHRTCTGCQHHDANAMQATGFLLTTGEDVKFPSKPQDTSMAACSKEGTSRGGHVWSLLWALLGSFERCLILFCCTCGTCSAFLLRTC